MSRLRRRERFRASPQFAPPRKIASRFFDPPPKGGCFHGRYFPNVERKGRERPLAIGSPLSRRRTVSLKPLASDSSLNHTPSGELRVTPSKSVAIICVD